MVTIIRTASSTSNVLLGDEEMNSMRPPCNPGVRFEWFKMKCELLLGSVPPHSPEANPTAHHAGSFLSASKWSFCFVFPGEACIGLHRIYFCYGHIPDVLPVKICQNLSLFLSEYIHVFSNLPTCGGARLGVPVEARVDCELPGAVWPMQYPRGV